jgi:hypothetical protein
MAPDTAEKANPAIPDTNEPANTEITITTDDVTWMDESEANGANKVLNGSVIDASW